MKVHQGGCFFCFFGFEGKDARGVGGIWIWVCVDKPMFYLRVGGYFEREMMRWDNIMERDLVLWMDEDSIYPPLLKLRPSRASKLAKIITWLGRWYSGSHEQDSRLSRGNGNEWNEVG